MAVSAPPKKKAAAIPAEQTKKVDEKKIDEIINRGSSTIAKADPEEPDQLKHFNIKIMASRLDQIDELRAKRPRKPTSRRKVGISLQDWMIEAIEEKIKREKKHYNVN